MSSMPSEGAAAAAPRLPTVQPGEWFREESSMWPGQCMSLKCAEEVLNVRTAYQHLTVFRNDGPWGHVMTLDGCIQLTDKDEFVYHEMMAHVPVCAFLSSPFRSSSSPSAAPAAPVVRVLIVGGGDGGVLREVLRHKLVGECVLVDIDGDVIEASKRFFPAVACGFADPRAKVIVGDGAMYVASAAAASFDVVIIDSSDPEGPASVLFGEDFYRHVLRVLKPGGVVCAQGESAWLHMHLIESMMKMLRTLVGTLPTTAGGAAERFSEVKYAMIYIPSYPAGSIGALLAVKASGENADEGRGAVTSALATVSPLSMSADVAEHLKYYDHDVHKAAFVLPRFAQRLNHSS